MDIPGLDEAFIQQHAAEGSYERGRDYERSGAVISLKRTSDGTVDALVKGSQYAPYAVRIRHGSTSINSVECSCPYFAGAWCKHVVAALLACLDTSVREHESASAGRLVDHMEKEELRLLLDRVAARHPELLDWIREEMRQL